MASNFQNHILVYEEDFQRQYLIPKTMKQEFYKWQDEFGNGEHEDDHQERMEKYLVNSDDSVALIAAELQDLRKKLTPKKPIRKRVK